MSRSSFIQRRHPRLISQDSFNRADNTSSLGSTDGPGSHDPLTWTAQNGTWGILSNHAYNPSGTGLLAATVDLGQADVELDLLFLATVNLVGVIFRYTDASNHWTMQSVAGTATTSLIKRVAGTNTTVTTGARFNNGDHCAILLSGTSIAVYKNQISLLSATDSFNQTATKHGMMTGVGNSAVSWDNWQAYSLVG